MPHFYAHRVFGDLVWNALPTDMQNKLAPQQDAFSLGLYGPDPLFFLSGRIAREGHGQHHESPQSVLERYRGHPQALGYAAGWLCHYMLDTRCHPIVLSASGRSSLRHAHIELALDRRLMKTHPLPKEATYRPEAFAAAALGCTLATADDFAKGLKGFYRFSYTTAALYHRRGNGTTTAKLTAQLYRMVPACAVMVAKLIYCLEQNKELDWLPEANFYGQ